ncbi:MAG: T9SS type A sorting domain-containing protein, partial [Chitinophagales bacterium]
IVFTINAQVPTGPEIAWQRCYGTSGYDFFTDAITTSDGGFAAFVYYDHEDGDFIDSLNAYGRFLKFDENFNLIWQRSYEDIGFEQILEVSDGFVLCGATYIDTGFAAENHGLADIVLVKTDINGIYQWSHCYGSTGVDNFTAIIATSDGGYIISGSTYGSNGDIPFHYGSGFTTDGIILKIDNIGNVDWINVIGGSDYDFTEGNVIQLDSFYIVFAASFSNDYDLADFTFDGQKIWLMKFNLIGVKVNEIVYEGGNPILGFYSSTLINNNKIIVTGTSFANSVDFPGPAGHLIDDGYIALFDTTLQLTDLHQFGGSESDLIYTLRINSKNEFICFGSSRSSDFDVPANYNMNEERDNWLLAIDSNFNLLWSQNFGGSNPNGEYTYKITTAPGTLLYNNNYIYYFGQCIVPDVLPDYDIACGHINPDLDDDTDAWLVAFDLSTVNIDTPIVENNFSIYPNPTENTIYVLNNMLDSNEYRFSIFNALGQKLLETSLINNKENIINIQTLPSGLYVAAILRDGIIIQSEKIILQ